MPGPFKVPDGPWVPSLEDMDNWQFDENVWLREENEDLTYEAAVATQKLSRIVDEYELKNQRLKKRIDKWQKTKQDENHTLAIKIGKLYDLLLENNITIPEDLTWPRTPKTTTEI